MKVMDPSHTQSKDFVKWKLAVADAIAQEATVYDWLGVSEILRDADRISDDVVSTLLLPGRDYQKDSGVHRFYF
jgi:hypothetical protein